MPREPVWFQRRQPYATMHAARAAKKNRRAFFELMRKYKIESGAYREDAPAG